MIDDQEEVLATAQVGNEMVKAKAILNFASSITYEQVADFIRACYETTKHDRGTMIVNSLGLISEVIINNPGDARVMLSQERAKAHSEMTTFCEVFQKRVNRLGLKAEISVVYSELPATPVISESDEIK